MTVVNELSAIVLALMKCAADTNCIRFSAQEQPAVYQEAEFIHGFF